MDIIKAMRSALNLEEEKLALYMSDLSEYCYCAGWMDNLEYALWDAVLNGERKYGREIITRWHIEELKHLAESCDCWIYFDDVEEETAIPLDAWRKQFLIDVQQNPSLLRG